MTPYRIRSQSVSERLRRGASAGGLAVELIHVLKTKTPLSCGDNGVRGRVARDSQGPQIELPCRSSTKFFSNSIRKGYSVNEKTPVLKRFLPNFGEAQKSGGIRQNLMERESTIMKHRMRFVILLLVVCLAQGRAQTLQDTTVQKTTVQGKTVPERLGYPASARLLVIHADDLGMNHSVNRATFEALEKGWITSASILVPCPWFPEVARWAKQHPNADLGIHLALTSEWTDLRWGPVSGVGSVRSLVDAQGYFPLDTPDVAKNAKMTEVEYELRSQIDRAKNAGIPLTHLDMHMAGMVSSGELFGVYRRLRDEYKLPILLEPS